VEGYLFSALLDKEIDKDVTFYGVVLHGEVVQFVLILQNKREMYLYL
jgi:hypothetical protein